MLAIVLMRRVVLMVAVLTVPVSSLAADETPPMIMHEAPETAQPGQPLTIVATIKDENGVFEPTLYYRTDLAPSYSSAQLTPQGNNKFAAAIVAPASGKEILYFIEAFDNRGNGPARHGTPEQPHRTRLISATPVATGQGEEKAIVASAPLPEVEIATGGDTSGGLDLSYGEPTRRGPWAYVTLGVGALAVVGGVLFGLQARSAAGDWAVSTNQAAWHDAESRAQGAATLATVSWIAAGALTAGGAGLFFFTKF